MNLRARDLLSAARVRAVQKHPYLATALFSLRPVEVPGLGTMAVNAQWQMAYDPDKVEQWGSIGTASVVVHEVQHLLREHPERFADWMSSGAARPRLAAYLAAHGADTSDTTSKLQMLFNIAGDAEINDDVEKAGWKLPAANGEKMVRASLFGSVDGLTAEEYADHMMAQAEKDGQQPKPPQSSGGQPQQGQGEGQGEGEGEGQGEGQPKGTPGCGGSCGHCDAGAQGWDKKLPPNAPEGMDRAEADLVRRQTAQEIADHIQQHGRGTVPLGLAVWAEKLIAPPKVDWRKRLSALVKNAVAMASGSDDYTYLKRSRRQTMMRAALGARCPILPGLNKPVPAVKLVLDTSGSMNGGPLEAALSEVMGIVKALGSPCEVLAVDAAVHAVKRVATVSDLKKVTVGGGGTDMRVGIAKAAEDGKANVIIVLTDGYTPWPDADSMPRKARLVAAVIGDTDVPDHIRAVVRVKLGD